MNRYFLLCGVICGVLLVCQVCAQSTQASLQKWATVTGQVLDSEDHPVVGARITFFPLDVGTSGPLPRSPITDAMGGISFQSPRTLGEYASARSRKVLATPTHKVYCFRHRPTICPRFP